MDVIKKTTMTRTELENLGYAVVVSPGGYQVRYGTLLIENWNTPGKFLPAVKFYTAMAWEAVKKHFCENSDIATLKPDDEFTFWSGKVFRVESIEGDVLHCVTIKPVAPHGADVTKRFRISELTVAVDVEISEEEVTS